MENSKKREKLKLIGSQSETALNTRCQRRLLLKCGLQLVVFLVLIGMPAFCQITDLSSTFVSYKSDTAEKLCEDASNARAKGDYSQSIDLWKMALQLDGQPTINGICFQTTCLRGLAECYALLDNYSDAEREALRALDLAKAFECRECICDVLMTLGWIKEMRSDSASALRFYVQALEKLRPGSLQRGEVLNYITHAQISLGHYSTAERIAQKASRYLAHHAPRRDDALLLANLAVLYDDYKERYTEAEAFGLGALHAMEECVGSGSKELIPFLELAAKVEACDPQTYAERLSLLKEAIDLRKQYYGHYDETAQKDGKEVEWLEGMLNSNPKNIEKIQSEKLGGYYGRQPLH
jgi:tetratricopeptide (TPR) repeat protein